MEKGIKQRIFQLLLGFISDKRKEAEKCSASGMVFFIFQDETLVEKVIKQSIFH